MDSSTTPLWKSQTCKLGVIDHFVHFSILHAACSQQGERFTTNFSKKQPRTIASPLDLGSSGSLCSVDWKFVNVSGQLIGPIFRGQVVQELPMRNIPHQRRWRIEDGPTSMLSVTQHKTRLTKRYSFYFELLNVVYNSYHTKSLMHLAQKTQLTVYTSKFHPNSSMVERMWKPGRKAVYTGTTQSVHQSWHDCVRTQVVDNTTNRTITICLWFNTFNAVVATSDCSWPRTLHIAVSAAATASTICTA